MIHIYPVTKTAQDIENYQVFIGGRQVPVQTARVSAVPFNRRWPGHQREMEQTELVNFVLLSADEPLDFYIKSKMPVEKAEIRPASLGVEAKVNAGAIAFRLEKPAYFTVEPFGRKNVLHIFVDAEMDCNVDREAADVIYFGVGEHEAGEIWLTDGQTLFIDEGAVVYGNVRAKDAKNIRILGAGILDNSRNREKILFEAKAENNFAAVYNVERKQTIWLEYCENIEINGITIRDSLCYNIRPVGCKNIHISQVKMIGNWRYNSDGIDMHNCEDVLIENCFIRTFDDCICVKGFDFWDEENPTEALEKAIHHNGGSYDTFRNVRVRGCTLFNDWGKCLEIGAETKAMTICDIVFEDCDIIHLTGGALDCYNIDYADVHQVTWRNIRIEYDDRYERPKIQKYDGEIYVNEEGYIPKTIGVVVDYHPEYSVGSAQRGSNHGIFFDNIRIYGKHKPQMTFKGYDEEHKTYDVRIEDMYWNDEPISSMEKVDVKFKGYTENIQLVSYAQNSKNTVDSKNQMKQTKRVRFEGKDNTGSRIMFLGNSITLHGVCPQIGWFDERGMAASEKSKDYVHRVMAMVREVDAEAAFCICQAADWERNYQKGEETFSAFEEAAQFGADIIVMRLAENCSAKTFEAETFETQLKKLLAFLDSKGTAKIIYTTAFWHHPADDRIIKMAQQDGESAVLLGDLGENPEMRAHGLYEHKGVAHHPGDEGMKQIANRIFKRIFAYYEEKMDEN